MSENLLLQKIDDLDPSRIDPKLKKVLYALEFAIRQLEDRVRELERRTPKPPDERVGWAREEER
jgi:hypothetical protein